MKILVGVLGRAGFIRASCALLPFAYSGAMKFDALGRIVVAG